MVTKYIAGLRVLLVRRVVTVLVAACIAASLIVVLVQVNPNPRLPDFQKIAGGIPYMSGPQHPIIDKCDMKNRTDAPERWKAIREKYSSLREDRFTIAMQTFNQPQELDDVLRILLTDEIPSLHEVVVVWNNIEEPPPGNFKSEHGVPVRYRKSAVNSRNQKFLPDADFQTKAILLSDSDVYYKPGDLEFAFQAWRNFGQNRLTGALPRCTAQGQDGKWEYSLCSNDADKDAYSMIVTNLCFSHISFLDFYSSDDVVMTKARKYVDDHAGCEEVAMNYMSSYLTGQGHLLVRGREKHVDFFEPKGSDVDQQSKYLESKSKCLNDLNEIFGCMPLVNETGHIERGVVL